MAAWQTRKTQKLDLAVQPLGSDTAVHFGSNIDRCLVPERISSPSRSTVKKGEPPRSQQPTVPLYTRVPALISRRGRWRAR